MSSIRNNSIWANKIKVTQCVSRERKLTLSGTVDSYGRVERLEQNNNNSHKAVTYELV